MQLMVAADVMVREAAESDLGAVVTVLRAANAQFADVLPATFYHAYLSNALDVRSRLEESQLLVAEREGQIVGTITLYPDASHEGWGWPAQWSGIRAVAVAPAARGHGIGSQLTQACIDRAREIGATAVCLHTAAFMEAAVAMYERLGFQRRAAFDQDADALFPAAGDSSIAILGYVLDL